MCADEIAKIKDSIVAARAKLLATTDDLDEVAWEWRPGDGRWSVRMTLAHVGRAQWGHVEVARRLVAGKSLELPNFDLDTWNAAEVAKRADWSVAQVVADLGAAQQETLRFMDSLGAEKLTITGLHPALGEISVGQVLRVIALHDHMHRRDILRLSREIGIE